MRNVLLAVFVLVAATANGADNAPKATGTLHGKNVKFPEKGIMDGLKSTSGLLESCCGEGLYEAVVACPHFVVQLL